MGLRDRFGRSGKGGDGDGFDLAPVRSEDYRRYQEAEEAAAGSRYERWARRAADVTTVDLAGLPLLSGRVDSLEENMRVARINLSQEEVGALLMIPLAPMVVAALLTTLLFSGPIGVIIWGAPGFWAYWVLSYPGFRATVLRIKSSDEALRVILYMAMQLNMNPSLEGAVRNAADHTGGPVSRDLSKILWDTQTGRFTSMKDGIAEYMQLWREWSQDFVKSFEFLIDATSRTGEGRDRMLDKGQDNMIQATRDKMSQYARNLSSPVKVIHMAGIVLPLMGLIMFPLVSIFLNQGQASVGGMTLYIAFGYLFILPLFLFFLVKRLISKRPGAYSQPSLENVPNLPPRDKLQLTVGDTTYELPVRLVAVTVGFLIMLPGIIYYAELIGNIISMQVSITSEGTLTGPAADQWSDFIETQYEVENVVPNVVQGMTLFWGLVAGLVTYFLGRSYRLKKIREQIKEIEDGIDVGLTALENMLSKNLPVERAVYEVVREYEKIGQGDHPLHGFFSLTLNNIEGKGLPFHEAIFDKNEGSITYYPSSLLENTMQVVANSTAKGSAAMATNIRTLNEYIQNQKRVEELIKELLDETVGQMKIQARYIAPIITAAAASMSLLIVEILFQISQRLEDIEQTLSPGGGGGVSGGITGQLSLVKNLDSSIPPTLLLLIVSLYLIEVSLILAYFTNGIQHGFDEINRDLEISRTLIYAGIVFSIIVIIASVYITPFIAGIGAA